MSENMTEIISDIFPCHNPKGLGGVNFLSTLPTVFIASYVIPSKVNFF